MIQAYAERYGVQVWPFTYQTDVHFRLEQVERKLRAEEIKHAAAVASGGATRPAVFSPRRRSRKSAPGRTRHSAVSQSGTGGDLDCEAVCQSPRAEHSAGEVGACHFSIFFHINAVPGLHYWTEVNDISFPGRVAC